MAFFSSSATFFSSSSVPASKIKFLELGAYRSFNNVLPKTLSFKGSTMSPPSIKGFIKIPDVVPQSSSTTTKS